MSKAKNNKRLTELTKCDCCGKMGYNETHELFGGPYRQRSIKYGLQVILCPECHRGDLGVHKDKALMLHYHQKGEIMALQRFDWNIEDFIKNFGRNYI